MRARSFRHCLIVLVIALSGPLAGAGPKPAVNSGSDGIALKGYDVVAYAVAGAAVKGTPQFPYAWNGAVWLFSTADNRAGFIKSPEKYAPQFGGYCAWAVSRGYTADVDPEAWKIVDGRLYLNYSKSVQRRWEQDIPGNIAKAKGNWPGILDR